MSDEKATRTVSSLRTYQQRRDAEGRAQGGRLKIIDLFLLVERFGSDADYATGEDELYLDTETGDLVWVWPTDESAESAGGNPGEAAVDRVRVQSRRFLHIPRSLDHGDHHEILRAFLTSEWCADPAEVRRAHEAYDGSIGRWKTRVDDPVKYAYYDYRDAETTARLREFLREHGIEVPE